MTLSHNAPEGTKRALVEADLHLFGQQGFAATSTRQIASRAGTNVASIAYHFGCKDGLRQACAAKCARLIGALMLPTAVSPQGPLAAQDALCQML